MYHYVEDKKFLERAKKACSEIMSEVELLLRDEYDTNTQFFLIGSGARNMITQNEGESIDFDYNLNVLDYVGTLKEIKDRVINAFNIVLRNKKLEDVDDSTSSVTMKNIYFEDQPNIKFTMDIAIVEQNKEGHWCRLIHDKNVIPNRYFWNETPNSQNYTDRARAIKKVGAWLDVRTQYLNIKNKYLKQNNHTHPSFVCYIEAVNNVYNDLNQRR